MADVADEGIIEGIIEDVNDTSVVPQANASWLCGSAGPLWNHTLSWDTGDGNPGENGPKVYLGYIFNINFGNFFS